MDELGENYFTSNASNQYLMIVAHTHSEILPAAAHIDGAARAQTVHIESNLNFYRLLQAFWSKTGYGDLMKTSFNVRCEPIVNSVIDAINCFQNTEMDDLIRGSYWFSK